MYSSEGLSGWEIVAASGLLSVAMLLISALIGSLVAFFATRESKVFAKTAGSKEEVLRTGRSSPSLASLPQAS